MKRMNGRWYQQDIINNWSATWLGRMGVVTFPDRLLPVWERKIFIFNAAYVSSTDPFSLAQNFKSHQRHVSARRFDKKLFPRLLDMQHRQTDERQVYIPSKYERWSEGRIFTIAKNARWDKDRRGRKSRGTKYIRRVQWYCQLRDANKQTSRCISNPTAESLRFRIRIRGCYLYHLRSAMPRQHCTSNLS